MILVFGRWWQGRDKTRRSGPAGYRAYAIGDVHGRLDLLNGLLRQIDVDHRSRGGGAKPLLIFLGDLIDRGPQSREVVDKALGGALPGFGSVVLAGNHEEVLIRVLEGEPGLLPEWLRFGGWECLQSYGMDPLALSALPERSAVAQIQAALGPEHRNFLANLADTFRFGDYLFVHAGIRPGIALESQSSVDLRWIRQPFLGDRRDHGLMIVHGHTITAEVDERHNRIAIDTGAYRSGVLTALAIEGGKRWVLQEVGAASDAKAADAISTARDATRA